MLPNLLEFLRTWGGVIGPTLDIVGALLVFYGAYVSFPRARALERSAPTATIDDLGAPEIIERNDMFAEDRAKERLRASRFGTVGLLCFLLGFLCQALAGWPKT